MDNETTRSVIGTDLLVKGELSSKGAIWIHGTLEGDATANTVVVEKDGLVKGSLSADTVVIAGKVEGEISARSVEIKEGGHVNAEVQHEQISVASGAVLLGQVKRRSTTTSRPRSTEKEAATA